MKSHEFMNERVLSSIGAGLARYGLLGVNQRAKQAGKDAASNYAASQQALNFSAWANEINRILHTYMNIPSQSASSASTITTPSTSTAQPTTQPTAQPTTQPAAQPTAQPAAQPAAQPTAQPAAQPTAQSTAPALNPRAAGANIRSLNRARREQRALRETDLSNFSELNNILENIISMSDKDKNTLSKFNFINEVAAIDPATKNKVVSLVTTFVNSRLAGLKLNNKPANFDTGLNYAIDKFATAYLTNPKEAFKYKGLNSRGESPKDAGPLEMIFNMVQTLISMNRSGRGGRTEKQQLASEMPDNDISPVKVSDKTVVDATGKKVQLLYGYNSKEQKWYRTINPSATEPTNPADYLDPTKEPQNIAALNKKVADGEINTL